MLIIIYQATKLQTSDWSAGGVGPYYNGEQQQQQQHYSSGQPPQPQIKQKSYEELLEQVNCNYYCTDPQRS